MSTPTSTTSHDYSVTSSCETFSRDVDQHIRFLEITLQLAHFIDVQFAPLLRSVVALLELETIADSDEPRYNLDTMKTVLDQMPKMIDRFQSFDQVWLGSLHIVDFFLTYLSALLTEAHRTRPEMLKSSESVTFEEILEHQTMDELIMSLIEQKVTKLSFKGMETLAKDVEKTTRFRLFPQQEDLDRAIRIIEVRNLLVHNRGIVNKIFLSRVQNSKLELGNTILLEPSSVAKDMDFLIRSAIAIDRRAADKWCIPTPHEIEFIGPDTLGQIQENA